MRGSETVLWVMLHGVVLFAETIFKHNFTGKFSDDMLLNICHTNMMFFIVSSIVFWYNTYIRKRQKTLLIKGENES